MFLSIYGLGFLEYFLKLSRFYKSKNICRLKTDKKYKKEVQKIIIRCNKNFKLK